MFLVRSYQVEPVYGHVDTNHRYRTYLKFCSVIHDNCLALIHSVVWSQSMSSIER